MSRPDLIAAAAMLAVGAAAAVEAHRLLPFGTVRNPGPGFFPWWLGLALVLLALVLLATPLAWPSGAAPERGARGRVRKVAALLAVLGAYALALEALGYTLCTFGLVLFMLRVTDRQRWPVALGLAVLASGGTYLVFKAWLSVPLPAGTFLTG